MAPGAQGHGASAAVTNDKFFADELWDTRNDPDSCRHCGERFALGAMRYPVATGTRHGGGWGLASVCMDCFKCASKEETTGFHRFQRPCHGCGEPMLTPMQRIFRFQVCCNRCYQRYYRERRRGRRSVMDWKGWAPQCECCGRDFYKRRDAQFCSNKCRQWTHRRRIADR